MDLYIHTFAHPRNYRCVHLSTHLTLNGRDLCVQISGESPCALALLVDYMTPA